jgi:hypothetical protein
MFVYRNGIFNFPSFIFDLLFQMFQNPGRYNQGLHNCCFEQTVDIISSVTGQLLHEKVFDLFIENAVPTNFLLIFGSGGVLNLNTEAHLPPIVDKSLGDERYWVDPWGHFTCYNVKNVNISKHLSGELYLNNVSTSTLMEISHSSTNNSLLKFVAPFSIHFNTVVGLL